MHISNLPVEVLLSIFELLPKKDVLISLSVCLRWYAIASPICYKTIQLKDNHHDFVSTTKTAHTNGLHILHHTETIHIRHPANDLKGLDEEDFYTIMSKATHLKHIHLSASTRMITHYLIFLYKIPKDLVRLDTLQVPMTIYLDKKLLELYLSVVYRFRSTMTTLDLADFSVVRDCSLKLSDYLSRFKRPHKLTLHEGLLCGSDGRDSISSILSACSSLESLKIARTFTGHEFQSTGIPHTQLKSIRLNLVSLTHSFIDYCVEYLPNLEKIKLSMTTQSLIKFVHGVEKSAEKFGTYLKQVSYLDINYNLSSDRGSNVPFSGYGYFWDFVKSLYQSDFDCILNIDFSYGRDTSGLIVDKKTKTIKINLKWFILDSPPHNWLQHTQFLTFKKISLSCWHTKFCDMTHMTQALMSLVEKDGKKATDQIFIENESESLDISTPYRNKRSHVLLSEMVLNNDLLTSIGSTYPSVETIAIRYCRLSKECQRSNRYTLDLTSFENIHLFLLDSDIVLGERKTSIIRLDMLIQFIRYENNDINTYYLNPKLKSCHLIDPESVPSQRVKYIIKIQYKQIRSFIFRLNETNITIKL